MVAEYAAPRHVCSSAWSSAFPPLLRVPTWLPARGPALRGCAAFDERPCNFAACHAHRARALMRASPVRGEAERCGGGGALLRGPSAPLGRKTALSPLGRATRGLVAAAARAAAASAGGRPAEARSGRALGASAASLRKHGHLAAQSAAMTSRAFGVLVVPGPHECLERNLAIIASIFVNRHFFNPAII